MSAQEIFATHDCAVPGCPDEARERGGVCQFHSGSAARPSVVSPGSHAHLMRHEHGPSETKENPVAAPVVARDIVIDRIRAYHAEHGRIPTKREEPKLSSAAVHAFGTWGAAVEAAGFPKPTRGGGGKKRASSGFASSSEAKKTEPAARPTPPQPKPKAEPRSRIAPTITTGSLVQLATECEAAEAALTEARLRHETAIAALRSALDAAA